MALIGNAWIPYGLIRDPYFQEPLEPLSDSAFPIDRLFVGRQKEIDLLARQVLGASSSRSIIDGARGVGKTTVVSKLKAELAAQGVLTHERPVRVTAGMTHPEFVADVLRKLLQIRTTLNNTPNSSHESDGDVKFWLRIQHLVEGESVTNIGGSIAGIGVNASRTRITAERPLAPLFDELAGGFARLAKRLPRHDGNGGVFIHVNNLENLSRGEKQAASMLVADLRDYFLIQHSHWIFVGANDIGTTVFGDSAIRTIIPLDLSLAPLLADDVVEILDRRYAYVKGSSAHRQHQTYLAPIARAAIPELYQRYRGNLRGFLRLMSMAVQRYPFADTIHSLSTNDVIRTVAIEYRRELSTRLGVTDFGYIEKTIALTLSPRFRNIDIVTATGLKAPSVKQLIERLLTAGAVIHDGNIGRSTYYQLTGDAVTAFAM